jgi:hypothetical protein
VSNRPGGPGGDDIYVSTLQPDDTFGAPALVEELSSPFADVKPTLPRGGLEVILSSDRPGTFGNLDLWMSTRATNLPSLVGTRESRAGREHRVPRRRALDFVRRQGPPLARPFDPRNASAFFDIRMTTRTKLKKP